jgi:DNA processing protein
VIASGLLEIYPPEHDKLADEVAANGYLVSEAPPRMVPLSGAFPQRNRIISGLTLGTIVVEAAERSGALITARHAYEQGREVFAVPGPIDSRLSRGCHALIKDGAKLVESIDDVLAELGPLAENIQRDDGTLLTKPAELMLTKSSSKCWPRSRLRRHRWTPSCRRAACRFTACCRRSACWKCGGSCGG